MNNKVTYFASFDVEHILKKKKKFVGYKNIQINILIIHAYNLVTCGYLCIGFLDFMLKSKSLTDFTNIFSPNDFKKKNKKKWWYNYELF